MSPSPVVTTNLPAPQMNEHNFLLFSPAASSLPSTPGQPLEVDWNPRQIQLELSQAVQQLSHRGLKLAAKWAAEQLVGLSTSPATNTVEGQANYWAAQDNHEQDLSLFRRTPVESYAKTLMDVGDYLHAASVLSCPPENQANSGDILSIPGPSPELTSDGIFLRAYCLYMAGERRKEEEHLELQSDTLQPKTRRNPYTPQLLEELEELYGHLDAFGLYVYGMVLKEAQKEQIAFSTGPRLVDSHHRQAHTVLMESVLQFPWNWSAWLDLAELLSLDSNLEVTVEQVLQPTLAIHYMYHFFCAHLMAHHHQAHEDALVLYERLWEPIEGGPPLFQSSYIKSQMGVVHYHLRELKRALEWFDLIQDPFRLEDQDLYSNILYVREDKVALSQLAHRAVRVDKYRPETCCIIGNYYSLKQQRNKAILYFQRALKLDRSYTSAWTLMGHEYVELKQTESAMEAYRRAVTVSPKDYRAWYGLGQTYEFLNMHLYALTYYRKAAVLRPYDARMWCAVGLCLVALHKTSDAIRAYERAVALEDSEGIATQKLAILYRQEGRNEEAAQCYLRHLELRYMATSSSASPETPPSLDAIVEEVVVEAPEAEALLFLAQYHQAHGEYDTAALFCNRLVEYPGPEKEQAKGLLRDLRARGRARVASPPDDFQFSP